MGRDKKLDRLGLEQLVAFFEVGAADRNASGVRIRMNRLPRTRKEGSRLYGFSALPGSDRATRRRSSSVTICGCYGSSR